MTETFLTKEEIEELTGKKTRPAQKNVLNFLGIIYKENQYGDISILRNHVYIEYGGTSEFPNNTKEAKPNWEGINA